MNKIFSILALFLAISPMMASAEITQNLKYGQSNPQVSELQEYLIDRNMLSSGATGFFGALTLRAVKAYQASVGLPTTGFVGPMTREKINADLASLTSESTHAEISETGTSTPVSYGPCSNGAVFNYLTGQRCDGVMTPPPANVGSPSAPLTPNPAQATVAPTMDNQDPVYIATYISNQKSDYCFYEHASNNNPVRYSLDSFEGSGSVDGIDVPIGYIEISGIGERAIGKFEVSGSASNPETLINGQFFQVRADGDINSSTSNIPARFPIKLTQVKTPTNASVTLKSLKIGNKDIVVQGLPITTQSVSVTKCN